MQGELPEGWRRIPLGQLARLQKGVSYQGKYLDQPGPSLLGLGTIVPGGGVKLDAARTYAGPVKDRQRIGAGELLVALTDLTQDGRILGSPALVPDDAPGDYAVTHHVARVEVQATEGLDIRFLFYLLQSPDYFGYIRGVATGTTVRAVSPADAEGFKALIPPLEEQRRIAGVLGALDDKIEANRRMNRTLEALAQALFRQRFVALDGRTDLVDGGTELGEVPAGWRVAPIGSVVDVVGGSTPATNTPRFWEGGTFCWTTPKDLSGAESPVLLDTERRVTAEGLAAISSGLLPVGTVLLSSRAPIGYVALAGVPVAVNQGYIALRPGGALGPLYLYFWLHERMDEIESRAGGTTFQEISKRNFRPILAAVPPPVEVEAFEAVARPMFDRIASNAHQSRTLATLRDALLPELISGRLRVPEAARAPARDAGGPARGPAPTA